MLAVYLLYFIPTSGDEKFIYLPQGAPYSVRVSGSGTGLANIQVQSLDADGGVTGETTLADIPVTANTQATFSLDATQTLSPLSLDLNGDGTPDSVMTPKAGALVAYQPPAPPARAVAASSPGSISVPITTHSSAPVATSAPVSASVVPVKQLLTASSTHNAASIMRARPTLATPKKSSMPAISQTAAAALSDSHSATTTVPVYHWWQGAWSRLWSALTHIL